MDREEQIRTRAHQIWEREGRPEGREADHWAQASREIEDEAGQQRSAQDVGLSTGLQQGGTTPAGGANASMGAIGTGGGSTAGRATGSTRRKTNNP